jgi:MPBQ/MSBQ methyltransferase
MSHEETEGRIRGHYGFSGLIERIEQELRQKGIDPQRVTVEQLAPVDNFHWFRIAGTLALARAAALTGADRVLDVGGGIGGPARVLATRFGCQVTVLDLTPEYCAVGETLTTWTQLTDRVSFVCGSALSMPFADGSFDVVWTQHASMNMPDKARLYSEAARVVRPGGRFALFDVLAGPNQPIHFPVPWATDPSYSFLLSPEDTRALIAQAGFRELRWLTDQDHELMAELERPDASDEDAQATVELNSGLLYGADEALKRDNVRRNSEEGRILLAMGVFERI